MSISKSSVKEAWDDREAATAPEQAIVDASSLPTGRRRYFCVLGSFVVLVVLAAVITGVLIGSNNGGDKSQADTGAAVSSSDIVFQDASSASRSTNLLPPLNADDYFPLGDNVIEYQQDSTFGMIAIVSERSETWEGIAVDVTDLEVAYLRGP